MTAGMYCMSKMHDPESMIITVEYFHAFAVNFKKATLVWILFLFIGFIGAGDLFYAVRVADGGNLFFFLFALILLFVLISVMFWVFLLIGRYENSIQEHLKMRFFLRLAVSRGHCLCGLSGDFRLLLSFFIQSGW